MKTIFQRTSIDEPALFGPNDTTKAIENFPEICVSTFSENIIQTFSSLNATETIAQLHTANGAVPVYKLRYKNADIAFYMSRVGAPACVAGFEEIIAMGAKKFVLFGSCGVLDADKVKDQIIIPVSALRDEGTSYHYLAPAPEIEADAASIQKAKRGLPMGSTGKPSPPFRSDDGKDAWPWRWNALPCWRWQNIGTYHLFNFYMVRTALAPTHGKSGI